MEPGTGVTQPLAILLLNQDWFRGQLEQRGYRVKTAGFGPKGLDLDVLEVGTTLNEICTKLDFSPDRIIYCDDSSLPWMAGLESTEIPTVFISVDSFHHSNWHPHFAELFDAVLVAQLLELDLFKPKVPNCHWFPLWVSRRPHIEYKRDLGAVFRGTMDEKLHPERAIFFSKVNELVPVDACGGDWAEPYGRAQIVLNQSVRADLNFRVFETLISGALLITPKADNGLDRLFEEGRDYIGYEDGNATDAARLVKYFLNNSAECATIAASGRQKALANHSPEKRAKQLEEIFIPLRKRQLKSRMLAAFRAGVPTLFSLNTVARELKRDKWINYLGELLLQLPEGEKLTEFDWSSAQTVLVSMEENGMFELILKIVNKFKADSHDTLLWLFEIAALQGINKSERAMSIAKAVSHSPEELLLSVPVLLKDLQSKIRVSQ